jgi:hypothetical protein
MMGIIVVTRSPLLVVPIVDDRATPQQVEQLRELLSERADGVRLLEKWLYKAGCTSLSGLRRELAAKMIDYLTTARWEIQPSRSAHEKGDPCAI